MEYHHVDVFSRKPFSGNGLTVFMYDNEISSDIMQKITSEMRQFESIFLKSTEYSNTFKAKIYTIQEELDFAGHPILGAACVLHEKFKRSVVNAEWIFQLNTKNVRVKSKYCDLWYEAVMDQGAPIFSSPLNSKQSSLFFDALNLSSDDGVEQLPLQVVSTGLPYLIVPIKSNIEKAQISCSNFEALLQSVGAKFIYVFDTTTNEGRSWDNEGVFEDIATGSAAGSMGAYLIEHKRASPSDTIIVKQGRFLGRPSEIRVKVEGSLEQITSVLVSGDVCLIANGVIKNF